MKTAITTLHAPTAQGIYTQAIAYDGFVFLSGQIAIHPKTKLLVSKDIHQQAEQVFRNLSAVCNAAGGQLDNIVKLQVYVTDLQYMVIVNEVMKQFFQEPYPARSALGGVTLPQGALVEIDAIMARI